jgi:polar amino acid transport system substrate-binding protein
LKEIILFWYNSAKIISMIKYFFIFIFLVFSLAQAEELNIYYLEKPPYSYLEGGKIKGFLWERTENLLKKAKIPFTVDIRPAVRILKDIQDQHKIICSPGWFKTTEREAFAWFSPVIYKDMPGALVIHRDSKKTFAKFKNLLELLQDQKLKLGLVEGVSYGSLLDGIIKQSHGIVLKTFGDFQVTLSQVAHRRIDWTLVNTEELDFFKLRHPDEGKQLAVREFPNPPPQGERYFMCTKNMSEDLKKKIQKAVLSATENSTE